MFVTNNSLIISSVSPVSPKTYWPIINRFLNNKNIPIIPPVLFEGKLISDFEEKAELFNNHFVQKCKYRTKP